MGRGDVGQELVVHGPALGAHLRDGKAVVLGRPGDRGIGAAAMVFCREEAESFPTIRDAVACPNLIEAARRSRSSQFSSISPRLIFWVGSGPATGQAAVTSRWESIRYRVIFPRSRMWSGRVRAQVNEPVTPRGHTRELSRPPDAARA
ncbi:hypothetical protein GCM10020000_05090 [Streptomyces olivoverticillatus]